MSTFIQTNQHRLQTTDGVDILFIRGEDNNVYTWDNKWETKWSHFASVPSTAYHDLCVDLSSFSELHSGAWQFSQLRSGGSSKLEFPDSPPHFQKFIYDKFYNLKPIKIPFAFSEINAENIMEFQDAIAAYFPRGGSGYYSPFAHTYQFEKNLSEGEQIAKATERGADTLQNYYRSFSEDTPDEKKKKRELSYDFFTKWSQTSPELAYEDPSFWEDLAELPDELRKEVFGHRYSLMNTFDFNKKISFEVGLRGVSAYARTCGSEKFTKEIVEGCASLHSFWKDSYGFKAPFGFQTSVYSGFDFEWNEGKVEEILSALFSSPETSSLLDLNSLSQSVLALVKTDEGSHARLEENQAAYLLLSLDYLLSHREEESFPEYGKRMFQGKQFCPTLQSLLDKEEIRGLDAIMETGRDIVDPSRVKTKNIQSEQMHGVREAEAEAVADKPEEGKGETRVSKKSSKTASRAPKI